MELIIFIVLVSMFCPGSGSSGGGDGLAMIFVFFLTCAVLLGWVCAPLFAADQLDKMFGAQSWHWWTCCVGWYGGSIALNYFLAVRSEKRRESMG